MSITVYKLVATTQPIRDRGTSSLQAAVVAIALSYVLSGCSSEPPKPIAPAAPHVSALQHILFVGDSFTHGRYTPVRGYNSGGQQSATTGSSLVFDENFGRTDARQESAAESGPWGGIPGIFAEFAVESGLNYDVHIEAISETSLLKNYEAASGVIDEPKWNAVVLQELSLLPIPGSISQSSISDPSDFCKSVQTIEKGVHAAAPAANVFLYETWAPGDLAASNSGNMADPAFRENYSQSLLNLGFDYHNVYYSAAMHDGDIAGVAPVGEAWAAAWAQGIANPNPFTAVSALPVLWYGSNTVNDPVIAAADYHHPSVFGAYLSALVLFQQITGTDARGLGAQDMAASQLGIPSNIAVELQQVAWQSVTLENSAPIRP
jgi:hypothetical protein